MPTIHLTTLIHAPVERVFNLSRHIALHKKSMEHTGERAVAGVTTGMINLGETVTWEARHLMKTRRFTSKITSMKTYDSFTDEMIKGDFKSFQHQHHFKQIENGTIIIDIINYEMPYGIIGQLVNGFYLHRYLESLIKKRNEVIKEYAESKRWEALLPDMIKAY
ncbi:MAG: SRPBCC family protein [Sphingobacteriales bacterium]|nr:SRPBCC family protein [Sphingobacteriales bacterium]